MSWVRFITNNHAVMEEHFHRTDTPQFKQPTGNSQHTAQLHLHSLLKEKISGHVITCVSCELKWSTEVSIPCCCPGPHMKHIRSQGIQAFNVSIPGGCFHNAIAALVLVLTTKEHSGDQVKISHCTMNRGTPLPCQNCHDETR